MDLLPHIEINPPVPATATIIWLHGIGADGNDFAPIVPELSLPSDSGLRFIFPHAPAIPVTVNGGCIMPAWYDILEIQIERKVDTEQLLASAAAIGKFIGHEQERGIAPENIVVAGFSQGGAVAYQVALSSRSRLGGLLCLSTYIATAGLYDPAHFSNDPKSTQLPVFIGHGTMDQVVPEKLGKQAVRTLQEFGFQPEYRAYPVEHNVSLEEIRDIGQWLTSTLNLGS